MAGARSRSPEKPSLVIGGVAVIAHGFARATVDIDAAVVAETQDVAQLISSAARHRLVPRIEDAGGFAEENLVLLLEHQPTGVPFDLSLARQAFEVEAAARPVMRSLQGIELRGPSLTDLLVYKLVAGRPQDLRDVEALLSTGAPSTRHRSSEPSPSSTRSWRWIARVTSGVCSTPAPGYGERTAASRDSVQLLWKPERAGRVLTDP